MRIGEIIHDGHISFLGVDLLVAALAPVPRKETELLARTALAALALSQGHAPQVVDMCCGSGNLACCLACHTDDARVWACDIVERCVELARRNVGKLGLQQRVQVYRGDLFASLGGLGLENGIDLVVCNPPYMPTRRIESTCRYLLKYEPREAFDGGPYGIRFHQRILRESLDYLRPGGLVMFEIGVGQDGDVQRLFERVKGYEDVRLIKDVWGQVRVVQARKAT